MDKKKKIEESLVTSTSLGTEYFSWATRATPLLSYHSKMEHPISKRYSRHVSRITIQKFQRKWLCYHEIDSQECHSYIQKMKISKSEVGGIQTCWIIKYWCSYRVSAEIICGSICNSNTFNPAIRTFNFSIPTICSIVSHLICKVLPEAQPFLVYSQPC